MTKNVSHYLMITQAIFAWDFRCWAPIQEIMRFIFQPPSKTKTLLREKIKSGTYGFTNVSEELIVPVTDNYISL